MEPSYNFVPYSDNYTGKKEEIKINVLSYADLTNRETYLTDLKGKKVIFLMLEVLSWGVISPIGVPKLIVLL